MIARMLNAWFGHFSPEEFKKFLVLGGVFALIIGIYWTLQSLKDSIFMSIVGKEYIPTAQLVSMGFLIPLIIGYSILVDKFNRHRMLSLLATTYSLGALIFGLFFLHPSVGLSNTTLDPFRISGWLWYLFVESYGCFMVTLFWAFVTDTTSPQSAKKGFSLIVMIGQMGSILAPLLITPLAGPSFWGSSTPLIFVCAALIFLIVPIIIWFIRSMPRQQMQGYQAHLDATQKKSKQSFLRGLTLITSNKYLLGIFAITILQGAIVTIIDFRFKYLVGHTILGQAARTVYLGNYAVWVNVATLSFLLLGISNIQRRLGIRYALCLMPCVIGGAMLAVYVAPIVSVLFWWLVIAKAFNYAMNVPAVKQLYVPTSHDAKYKSQAWLETFGSRGSQAVGSSVNITQQCLINGAGPVLLSACGILFSSLAVGSLALWFATALFLSNTYEKAIKEEKVVC